MKTLQQVVRRSLAPAVLLALGFFGTVGRGITQQPPEGSFTETVAVERINVEVRVLDRAGALVRGLSAGEFQVFHDGQEVEITNFTEFRDGLAVDGAGSASPAVGAGEEPVDHHLIVYFDDLHLQANHRSVIVEALRDFVAGEQIPAVRIMIVRQGAGLSIEAPFGSSIRDLEKALDRLEAAPPGISNEVATRQALDDIQRTWNSSRDTTGAAQQQMSQIPGSNLGGGGGTGGSPRDVTSSAGALSSGNVPATCDIFGSRVEAILNSWMAAHTSTTSTTLSSLADTASYLAGLPGIKSLLYVSDFLDTMPGQALANYANTICPGGQENLSLKTLGEQLGSAFEELTHHVAANRITIYSLQGGGLQVTSAGGARDRGGRAGSISTFEASNRAGNQSGLIKLAEDTGGRAAMNTNDYPEALDQLSDEMLNFYSLAFAPLGSTAGENHQIEVRMRDKGLQARFRTGYVDKSHDQRFSESLQGALYLGLVDNPLQARLAADAFRAGEEGTTVMPLRVVLPVELVSFVPQGDQLLATVLVRILSRDLETGRTGMADRSFQVKHQPGSGGEWMQLPVELGLIPGSHIIALGVLDQESGVTSLVSTTIEVPSF